MEILLTAAALPTEAGDSADPDSDPPPTLPTAPARSPLASLEASASSGAEATSLQTFDWHDLVEPDLWSQVPDDVGELLRVLASSDLYVQDEVDVRLHPTLSRVWSRKGKRGQRLVRAPGQSRKFVGFGAIDWRDGWLGIAYGLKRTADVFCLELDCLVERSQGRGRKAMVILDNLGIHTPQGSKLLRETLGKHGDKLVLVHTPPYDPESNPTERLWPHFRLAVTHNHHRDDLATLYADTLEYFRELDRQPDRVLSHIGSPYAVSTEKTTNGTPDANADPPWK